MNLFIDCGSTAHWHWDRPRIDPMQPHLIRLAACLENELGEVVDRFSTIVRPLYGWLPIDPDVTLIHRVDDTAALEGRLLSDVIGKFAGLTAYADVVIGHSVEFHRRMLIRAYGDIGIPPPEVLIKPALSICTMQQSTAIVRVPNTNKKGYKWPTLVEAAEHFAIGGDPVPERPTDPIDLGTWMNDRVRGIYHGIEAALSQRQRRVSA